MKFYTHPDYKLNEKAWQSYYDLYEGDQEVMRSKYLIPFALEDNTLEGKRAWNQRAGRTFYTNFAEPILSIWLSLLFKKSPDFSKIADIFEPDELADVDGNGNSLENFIKQLTLYYLQYGKVVVLVDTPSVIAKSKEDERVLGLRPYGEIISPLAIPDWEYQLLNGVTQGDLKFIHHQFVRVPERGSASDQPVQELIRREFVSLGSGYKVTLYKATTDKQNNSTQAVTAEQLLALGNNPETQWQIVGESKEISAVNNIPCAIGEGRSWLKEISPLLQRYYNLDSNHDNIIYFQGYTRLAVAGDTNSAAIRPASESTIMHLPAGATVTQITAEDPSASEKNRAELRNTIFRVGLNQIRQLDGGSQAVQGAETQREEKEYTLALAKETIQDVAAIANQFVKHWAAFKSKPDYENEIEFNTDFGAQDYKDFLAIYGAFQAQRVSYPTTSKAMDKKLIEIAGLPKEDADDANKEIHTAVITAPDSAPIGADLLSRFKPSTNG